MLECTASVMIAIEPVMAPATTFSTIRAEFETTDRRAAPNLVEPLTASGAIRGVFRTRARPALSPVRRGRSPFTAPGAATRRGRARRGRDG